MRQSGVTYLPADCCFSELATKRVRLDQGSNPQSTALEASTLNITSPMLFPVLGKSGFSRIYSQICIKRSLWDKENVTRGSIHMKFYMTGQEKGDLLIQVTA
jgi:hypothetical protein